MELIKFILSPLYLIWLLWGCGGITEDEIENNNKQVATHKIVSPKEKEQPIKQDPELINDAINALVYLKIPKTKAANVVKQTAKCNPGCTLSELIKLSLKNKP